VRADCALTYESSNNCRHPGGPTPLPIGPRLEVCCHRHTHTRTAPTYLQGGDACPNQRQAAIITTRTCPSAPRPVSSARRSSQSSIVYLLSSSTPDYNE
jgi:hypothetical protein